MSDINIKIEEQQVSLLSGQTKELKVTGIPEGSVASAVKWESSDTGVVAFVGETKDKPKVTIKEVALGNATVKASVTYEGQTYESACEVTVIGVKLKESELFLEVGKTESLEYYVNPSESTIKWNSDNSCVSVDSNGKITANTPGKATVKATVTYGDQTYESACKVTVWNVIGLNKSDLVLGVGETESLEYNVNPSDSTIKWNSDNSCVSVDSNGKITANTLGKATVKATVTYEGQTYESECEVTVIGVKLEKSELVLGVGETESLEYNVNPSDSTIKWNSDNSCVSVDSNGTITANTPGKATVKATVTYDDQTYESECEVTVLGVKLKESELFLEVGKTESLEYTVNLPKSSETRITWSSDNSCVTVNSNGKITTHSPGVANITAEVVYLGKPYKSECQVTVIGLAESELSLISGDSKTIQAKIPEGASVSWKSIDQSVATVPENSTDTSVEVTAKVSGTTEIIATIKYKEKDYTATCYVTVDVVSLNFSELPLIVKGTQTIKANIPKDATIEWKSGNEKIATVPANSKYNSVVVTAVGTGTTEITATITYQGKDYTATCYVTVGVISLNFSELPLIVKGTHTIKANIPDNASITWVSGNEKIATVPANSKDNSVVVTAVATGTTKITANIKYNNIDYSATCKVTVNPLRLNRDKLTLLKEKEFQLEVIPSDLSVEWSSSNESVASVDKGLVTARLEGTTQVTATVEIKGEKYSATCLVTVEDKVLDVLVNLINERFDQYKDIKDKYSFSFTPKGKKNEMVLVQGEETKCESDENVFSFVLTEVSFHKEIYQPGYVEVVIKTNAALSLFEGLVSLKYKKEGVDLPYSIADKYYIFEKKKKRGYVTLKAYSADQFLTLDKFCQVYTGKTLVDGMIAKTFDNYGETPNFKQYDVITKDETEKYIANLQHLAETARIPYAVQYNESFYDFLVRICNRNGEFLYLENNKLYIGLPECDESITPKEIVESDDVEIECFESGWSYTDNVITMASDCLKENGVGGEWKSSPNGSFIQRPNGAQMFSDDSVYPEQYFELYRKNGVDKYEYASNKDFSRPIQTASGLLKSFAEAQTLMEAVSKTAFKAAISMGVKAYTKKNLNDKYDETYFPTQILKTAGNKYYPFSAPTTNMQPGVDGYFYENILKKEKETEKKKVIVNCSTCQNHYLGDIVTIEDKKYVVYKIKGGAKVKEGVLEGVRRYVESYELLLLPIDDSNKFYPLPMPELRIRKASPQRAIVKNPMDPQKLGRVQVAYPWQASDDTNFSPWLRVAYPMASEEGGFMFFPSVGDEVLIDYEGGNIDRPFVVGSFYSYDRKPAVPAQMHTTGVVKSITSLNGHHISFKDITQDAKFFANIVPVWSLISKFGVGADLDTDFINKHGKHLVGGFEISDYFGVYSIKGTSEDRNITISSPLGDIMLDAFTGITINAPHGDVKILGKNVDIEARNNLTITSGSNIGNPYFGDGTEGKIQQLKGDLKNFGLSLVGGLSKILGLNLSFHRTWLEVLLRPIGGTMLIKSYRYLCLESGQGKVNIVRTSSLDYIKDKNSFLHGFIRRKPAIGNSPDNIAAAVKRACAIYNEAANLVQEIEILCKYLLIELNNRDLGGTEFATADKDDVKTLIVNSFNELGKKEGRDKNVLYRNITFPTIKDKLKLLKIKGKVFNRTCRLLKEDQGSVKNELGNDINAVIEVIKTKFKDITTNNLNTGYFDNLNEITGNRSLKVQTPREIYTFLCHEFKSFFGQTYYIEDTNLRGILDDMRIQPQDVEQPQEEKILRKSSALLGQQNAIIKAKQVGIPSKLLGLAGFVDNLSWGMKDTGSILFSTQKGKTQMLDTDGVKNYNHVNAKTEDAKRLRALQILFELKNKQQDNGNQHPMGQQAPNPPAPSVVEAATDSNNQN